MSRTELADRVGVPIAILSILKTGKARAIRFSTLDSLCRELSCQPADILVFDPAPSDDALECGGEVEKDQQSAASCSAISSLIPALASENRAWNSASEKPRFSPVAWIST